MPKGGYKITEYGQNGQPVTPSYIGEGVTLYLSKCEKILKQLPSQSVDGVITDPPYGIGFKYNEHDDSPEGYGDWLWSILLECERCCKPGSPIFVWQAMLNVRRFTDWFPRDWRLFAGIRNYPTMFPKLNLQYCWDPIVVWWTDGPRWKCNDVYRSRDYHYGKTSVNGTSGHKFEAGHPCPRPLDQVTYIVKNLVRTGGVILDPFLGSGTTAVAANRTGRKCIGIEKDETYFNLARKRLEDEQGAGFVTGLRKCLSRKTRKG